MKTHELRNGVYYDVKEDKLFLIEDLDNYEVPPTGKTQITFKMVGRGNDIFDHAMVFDVKEDFEIGKLKYIGKL